MNIASFVVAFNIVISSLDPVFAQDLTYAPLTKEQIVESLIGQDSNIIIVPDSIIASSHIETCAQFFTGGHSKGFAYENDDGTTITDVYLLPNEGIILSSGDPQEFGDENNCEDESTFYDEDGVDYVDVNDDLKDATGQTESIFDVCFIQFDFEIQCGAGESFSFNYIFGSDEYSEYVDCAYNDAFALILNGENIAKITDSVTDTDVVSIKNVNKGVNEKYFHANDEDGGVYSQLQADGFTVLLTAAGTTAETNRIKIVVGDVGDAYVDSWILLEAGAFGCRSRPTSEPTSQPSLSLSPSKSGTPSLQPSESNAPSKSGAPSMQPSESNVPSKSPSDTPSISIAPSGTPSVSLFPSGAPSLSSAPSAPVGKSAKRSRASSNSKSSKTNGAEGSMITASQLKSGGAVVAASRLIGIGVAFATILAFGVGLILF